MRILMVIPTILLIGSTLGGCNTGAPQGVLPRDPVPPPPSLTGSISRQPTAARGTGDSLVQRRALSVPDRIAPPRPASIAVEPVVTGSGAGAGFRF